MLSIEDKKLSFQWGERELSNKIILANGKYHRGNKPSDDRVCV
jgi:hypothetical protein